MSLTSKEEGFSQAVALGELNQNECYRANYNCSNMLPQSVDQLASRLANKVKIQSRIQELRDAVTAAIVQKRVWDKERFIDEAESNLAQARRLDQMAPANGALQMIGKVTGIVQEQSPASEPALAAIIKLAGVLSEAQLRGLAEGKVIEVGGRVVDDE